MIDYRLIPVGWKSVCIRIGMSASEGDLACNKGLSFLRRRIGFYMFYPLPIVGESCVIYQFAAKIVAISQHERAALAKRIDMISLVAFPLSYASIVALLTGLH